jgi:hypothetical protein
VASETLSVRSGLEKAFAECLIEHDIPFTYESEKLPYEVPSSTHRYLADFTLHSGNIVETKGRLTGEDRKKMLLVRMANPEKEIIFVFSNKRKKLYKNSPTTYEGWCEKHNFNCFDIKEVVADPTILERVKRIEPKPKKTKRAKGEPRKRKTLQDLCNPGLPSKAERPSRSPKVGRRLHCRQAT